MAANEAPATVKDTAKRARPANDPAGPTGRLATWVAKTTLDDVPASVRDRAKHLVLDGIGCALVGAQLPVSRIGVQGVTALDSAGDVALVGWGGRATSAPSAAMLNSSFIQGFELNDDHPRPPLHSNSLVLPAMLAAAPRVGRVSGERFLLGAILGYETGPRVGGALGGLDMVSPGGHSGVVFAPLAAAAAAGTLYGLDAAGFEDAFGMAATQSCGLMSAMYESMVKRMQHGFASRNGLTAAALAAAGYVGIKRVFERPYGGWLAVFGEGHRTYPEDIYKGLGVLWETERIAGRAPAAGDRRSDERRLRRRCGPPRWRRAHRPVPPGPDQPRRRLGADRQDTDAPRKGLRQPPDRRAAHHPGAPDPHRRQHPHRQGRPPARHRRPEPDQRRYPRQVRQA